MGISVLRMMKEKQLSAHLLMSAMFILYGTALCACAADHSASTARDSWYNAVPPKTPGLWEWQELDRARIHQVMESKETQADDLLQNVPVLELTNEQASELVGRMLPELPRTRPYLARGLYLNRETGAFSVYVLDDRLLVHHGSLGRGAAPMKRQALVLQLEGEPTQVYVTCSMAE